MFAIYNKKIIEAMRALFFVSGGSIEKEKTKRINLITLTINTAVTMVAQYGIIDPVLNGIRYKILPRFIRVLGNAFTRVRNILFRLPSIISPRYFPKPLLSKTMFASDLLDYDMAEDLIKRLELLEKALIPKAKTNTKIFQGLSFVVLPLAILYLILSKDPRPEFIVVAISLMVSSLGQNYYMYTEEEILAKQLTDKKNILEKIAISYKPQISSIQCNHLITSKIVLAFSSYKGTPWISENQMAKLLKQCLLFHNVQDFSHYGNKISIRADFAINNQRAISIKKLFEESVARTQEILLLRKSLINLLKIIYGEIPEFFQIPLLEKNGLPSVRVEFNFPFWLESFVPKLKNLFQNNQVEVVTGENTLHLSITGWTCPSDAQLKAFKADLSKAYKERTEQKIVVAHQDPTETRPEESYSVMAEQLHERHKPKKTNVGKETKQHSAAEQKDLKISWVVKGKVVTFDPDNENCSVQPIRRSEGQHTFQSFITGHHFIRNEIPEDAVPERLWRAISQNIEAPKFVGRNQPGWAFWVSSQKDSEGKPFMSSLKLTFRGRDRGDVRLYTYETIHPNGSVLHTLTLAKPTAKNSAHKKDERNPALLSRKKQLALRA